MSADEKKIRPSQENIAIADYYLASPKTNVALQSGRLQLGSIASHVLTNYYRLSEKPNLTADEKRWLTNFRIFAEKKLPELAAQYASNIVYQLIDTFRQTTQVRVITAEGLKSNILTGLEREASTEPEKKEEPKK